MTLPKGNRIYSFACHFFLGALALYWELAETAPSGFSAHYSSWDAAFERLSGWLLEERSFVLSNDLGDRHEISLVLATAEKVGNQLIMEWLATFRSAANLAHARFPLLDWELCLYCYYCDFIVQVAKQFGFLFEQLPSDLGGYVYRYLAGAQLFEDVVGAFKVESYLLKTTVHTDDKTAHTAVLEMHTFTTKLALEWRQAVLSVSQS